VTELQLTLKFDIHIHIDIARPSTWS